MKIIKLESKVNPYALKLARQYRGYSQSELCKEVKGLSQSNLSKFEKGYFGMISESKLKEIMEFLNFPYSFLKSNIKEKLVTSLDF